VVPPEGGGRTFFRPAGLGRFRYSPTAHTVELLSSRSYELHLGTSFLCRAAPLFEGGCATFVFRGEESAFNSYFALTRRLPWKPGSTIAVFRQRVRQRSRPYSH